MAKTTGKTSKDKTSVTKTAGPKKSSSVKTKTVSKSATTGKFVNVSAKQGKASQATSPTRQNNLKRVFGRWPGDESEAEIQKALKDMS